MRNCGAVPAPFQPWPVFLAAMTDETIQLFSPGRASRVADVWIDFAGLLTGLLLFHWFRRQKKNETERSRRSDV